MQRTGQVAPTRWPTFLRLAGARELPEGLDGVSLLAALTGGRRRREAIYWHFPHYHHSPPAGTIPMVSYKLIESFEDNQVELYDLGQVLAEKAPELLADRRGWRKPVDAQMPDLRVVRAGRRADL